jgi:uncharacterized damage-inducible protein DinB
MKHEIEKIKSELQTSLEGSPWFGKSVYTMLSEVHPTIAYKKPFETGHSIIELLYHMITWAQFTRKRLAKETDDDIPAYDVLDWRMIDPLEHTWSKAIEEYKNVHSEIIALLEKADDSLLDQKVDFRDYNFSFLLNGFIQHNIYHLGQIAYVKKLYLQDEGHA